MLHLDRWLVALGFPGIVPADRGPVFMPIAIDENQGTIDMRLGYGYGKKMQWYQGLTVPTSDVVGSWSNPAFDIGPVPVLTSELNGIPLYLVDTTFAGRFEPGGLEATGVTVESLFDTSAVDQLLGFNPGGACALLANLGAPCTSCPSGPNQGQLLCLPVTIEDVTGPVLPGLVLVPVP